MNEATAGSRPLEISVVIPAFRRTALLRKAVLSALAQDFPPEAYEVIVVDSSPEDDNVKLVASLQDEAKCSLRCLTKPAEGPGPSRNLGAEQARGAIIAYMDSDCFADPHWLSRGLAAFEPTVGLVQGRVKRDPEGRMGPVVHYVEVERESYLYETANVFYRRACLLEIGGFPHDPTPRARVPVGGEDVLVGWRVKRRGWESRFSPEALVYHAVLPGSPLMWMMNYRLAIFPRLVRELPELRRVFLYRGYFLDEAQCWFALGVLGSLAAFAFWPALLAWLPYLVHRGAARSNIFRGPLRFVRALVYFPRDLATFLILSASSLYHRTPVL